MRNPGEHGSGPDVPAGKLNEDGSVHPVSCAGDLLKGRQGFALVSRDYNERRSVGAVEEKSESAGAPL